MSAKRKRGEPPKTKRTSDSDEFAFVTALSVEECVERLEQAAIRTLDRRLSVRTDGERFTVESFAPDVQVINVRITGGVRRDLRGTRVVAWGSAPNAPTVDAVLILAILVALTLAISGAIFLTALSRDDLGLEALLTLLMCLLTGILLSGGFYFLATYEQRTARRTVRELAQWLTELLYVPPGAGGGGVSG